MKLARNFSYQIKPCTVVVERIEIKKFLKNTYKNYSSESRIINSNIKRNKKFQLKDLSLKFKSYICDNINEKKTDESQNTVHVQLDKVNENNIDKSNFDFFFK